MPVRRAKRWWQHPALVWSGLVIALAVPIGLAMASPLLAWRQPVYIVAGFAGIAALGLLLIQPLLVAGVLPGLAGRLGRRGHGLIGALLVAAVLVHVGGLWVTSPPDVVDALTFTSPTPFSVWGVIAMWGVFATALLAAVRRRLRLRPRTWRISHTSLAALIVSGTIIHALLIQGAMEPISKAILCLLVAGVTGIILVRLRVWSGRRRPR